ncbi:MAG: low molecular weight protein-tyrosine-phosphatase [Pseudomonadota bacterium]
MLGRLLRGRGAGAEADAAPGAPGTAAVLMVCMGNICRSPTAEAVLRSRLRAAGLHRRVAVDSAGTIDHHAGAPPDPRAVRHGAARGYELQGLRARGVAPAAFERFRGVLAMDEANLEWLRGRCPAGSPARLGLLLDHAPHLGERAVPDPYYGPPAGFERVLDLVEAGCDGFVAWLLAGGLDSPRLDQGSS